MKCNFAFCLNIYVLLVIFHIDTCVMKMSKMQMTSQNKLQKGWLFISSKQFTDPKMYSPVPQESHDKFEGTFRLNTHFNPSNKNLIPDQFSFYFRVNNKLLYYSEYKDDFRILDSIHINFIQEISEYDSLNVNCFRISETENQKYWDLCTRSQIDKSNWLCSINQILGKPCPKGIIKNNSKQIQIIKKQILRQPLIIIPVASPFCNEKWDYKGHGDDWQCDCKEGKSQSPLDLPRIGEAVKFYNKTLFDFYPVDKDENGKDILMVFEDNKIKIKGRLGRLVSWDLIKYEVYEAHFHTNSEHTINGKHYDLELQIYYKAVTPGYIRKSAAVSIMFKVTPGTTNLFFDKDINILDLPDATDKTKTISKKINLSHLFMLNENDSYEGFSYYQYDGSLTAPPCQEETTWYIVSEPIPISYTTVEYFKDSLKPPSFEANKDCVKLDLINLEEPVENNRNIQPKNGRLVYYYQSDCILKDKKMPKIRSQGHYEKMKQEVTNYFFINDSKPSGLVGSFVVPDKEGKAFLPELNLAR